MHEWKLWNAVVQYFLKFADSDKIQKMYRLHLKNN